MSKQKHTINLREAELARRRGVVLDDEEGREGDVSTPDVSAPSTSGVRIRDVTTLCVPVRVVLRRTADQGRKRKGSEDIVEVEDDDTEVEKNSVEMEGTCVEGEEGSEGRGKESEEKSDWEESDAEPPHKLQKKRGRGRPATVPGHAGKFTAEKLAARSLARKERRMEEEQLRALDPATGLRKGPRLIKARREEQELLIEFRETSTPGIAAVVTEQVTLLRKVAQGCTNLRGATTKALWDASNTISAASAALNLRAQSSGAAVANPEWEDMREELRQLRVDMAHLRATNKTQKVDIKKGRAELERLEKELERERDERRREREVERKKEEERFEGKREESPPPRSSQRVDSPRKLRPRTARRVIVDESEESGMDVVGDMEEPVCPPSPALDCRPKLGEIIPSALRPPLKGVQAVIEEERLFEGPRDPPDMVRSEGPKPLTMDDMSKVLETMLPRLLAGMGIGPRKEPNVPLTSPDPGSAPVGHTGPGDKGGERRKAPKEQAGAASVGTRDQTRAPAAASAGPDGPKRKRRKKKRKGGDKASGNAGGLLSPFLLLPPPLPPLPGPPRWLSLLPPN